MLSANFRSTVLPFALTSGNSRLSPPSVPPAASRLLADPEPAGGSQQQQAVPCPSDGSTWALSGFPDTPGNLTQLISYVLLSCSSKGPGVIEKPGTVCPGLEMTDKFKLKPILVPSSAQCPLCKRLLQRSACSRSLVSTTSFSLTKLIPPSPAILWFV